MEDVDYLCLLQRHFNGFAGSCAVALLNVVIRRESAYLVEERIKVVVDGRKHLVSSVKSGVHACPDSRSKSLQLIGYPMAFGRTPKLFRHNNAPVVFEGVNIVRIEGGKVVEDWVFFDATGLQRKLARMQAA